MKFTNTIFIQFVQRRRIPLKSFSAFVWNSNIIVCDLKRVKLLYEKFSFIVYDRQEVGITLTGGTGFKIMMLLLRFDGYD